MAIFVYSYVNFSASCWQRKKYDAILREAAKRRIKCFWVNSRADLMRYEKIYQSEFSSLVLMPGSLNQFRKFRAMFDGLPLRAIVFAHHGAELLDNSSSYVMSDYMTAMQDTLALLRSHGASRIALFCVSKTSNHDVCHERAFRRFCPDGKIYYFVDVPPEHRTVDAVKELLSCEDRIDAVICCNDFIALSLAAVLNTVDPDWNQKLLLSSYSNLLIGQLYSPSITSASLAEEIGGIEVVRLHRTLEKNPQIHMLNAMMRVDISVRQSTAANAPAGLRFADYSVSDTNLEKALAPRTNLMRLELFLETCDALDMQLLCGLIKRTPQKELADRLSISTDSIKYRLRKIRKHFGYPDTKQLSEFLSYWIDPDKLTALIASEKSN